jgi:hypothetical protein
LRLLHRKHSTNGPREAPEVALRAGTLQLMPQSPLDMMSAIKRLQKSAQAATDNHWNELVSWGGIIQGLLDFQNIDVDELRDVFLPFKSRDPELLGFHKGSLLCVGEQSLGFSSKNTRHSPMGLSPYLAIPHAVILHNDERMRRARQYSPQVRARSGRYISITDTFNLLNQERSAVASFLPPVFHYDSEQKLYSDGHSRRGLSHVFTQSEARIITEAAALETRTKRRDLTFVLAGIMLAVLAGAQSALAQTRDVVPFYLLPSVGLLSVLGVFLWVRRL